MSISSCSHCCNTEGPVCFYCRCSVCGIAARPSDAVDASSTSVNKDSSPINRSSGRSLNSGGNITPIDAATTISCVSCQSLTHIGCARDPFSGVSLRNVLSSSLGASTKRSAAGISTGEETTTLIEKKNLTSTTPRAPGALRRNPSFSFFCSVDCAFGVSIVFNPQWNSFISQWVEERASSRWECAVTSASRSISSKSSLLKEKGERSSCGASALRETSYAETKGFTLPKAMQLSLPVCDVNAMESSEIPGNAPLLSSSIPSSFLQLRFEAWRTYFTVEMLHHAHPLASTVVPICRQFHSEATFLHLQALLSPTGQARRLCTLDPSEHPVGSCLALPDPKRWQDFSTPIKGGESNSFIWESKERIRQTASSPSKVIEKRVSQALLASSSSSAKRKLYGKGCQPDVSLGCLEERVAQKKDAAIKKVVLETQIVSKYKFSKGKTLRNEELKEVSPEEEGLRTGKKEKKER